MEYNPRYPQPFSLAQAIALDPAVARDEVTRLRNSLLHLRRSQSELQEYLQQEEDLEVRQAVNENETTIASQDERIFMLKLALTHHGYSVASEQTSASPNPSLSTPLRSGTDGPQNTTNFNSSGLDDSPLVEPSTVNPEPSEAEGRENGVYL